MAEQQTLQQNLETPYFQDIRSKMLAGEPIAGCHKCYAREKATGSSLRLETNAARPGVWENPAVLRSVEFYFGNLCNLKCRGCSSRHSTKWVQDEVALGMDPILIHKPHVTSFDVLEGSWQHLEDIKFVGGEPLMFPEHQNFMEKLDEHNRFERIALQYATNGTFRVSEKVLDFWRRARFVQISFSIDGLREGNDFFRSGSRWQQIVENIHWYREQLNGSNVSFGTHTVVNIYNVHELVEIDEWLNLEFPGMPGHKDCLFSPNSLDCRHLPVDQKALLIEHYSDWSERPGVTPLRQESYRYVRDFLRTPFKEDFLKFIDRDQELNRVRGVQLRDVNPYLADLVQRELQPLNLTL